jgi:hypothetical protein
MMSIKMSEEQLREMGYAIDPADPTVAIPAPKPDGPPDDSWDLETLALYAKTGLSEANRLERESIQIGRRSTLQIFRAGRALSIARRKLASEGWGKWIPWLAEHGIKRTTAWEAIELYNNAKVEKAVQNLTPSEAKRKFGVIRDKRSEPPFEGPMNEQLPNESRALCESTTHEPWDGEDSDEESQPEASGSNEAVDGPPMPTTVSIHFVLVLITSRLRMLVSEAEQVDWRDEERGELLPQIDEAILSLGSIRERIAPRAH